MTLDNDHLEDIADLVRQVRHDANNPLTAALGHVQLILETPDMPGGELRESLRVVESELLRLVRILRRLRDVRVPMDAGDGASGA